MKKHRTDAVSLVFGLIFAAAVGWWALASLTDSEVEAGWVAVAALLVIGVLVLISTVARPRRTKVTTPVGAGVLAGTEGSPVAGSPVAGRPDDYELDDDARATEPLSDRPATDLPDHATAEPLPDSPTTDLPASARDELDGVDRPDEPDPGRPA